MTIGVGGSGPRKLYATINKNGDAEFICGFTIPRQQIEWAMNAKFSPGDRLVLDCNHIEVRAVPKRQCNCLCGGNGCHT